jgi:hypothetical protein
MKVSAKKVAILQSNYIPWKGYFDLINMVDEFILLDDVQYTRGHWRNRNQIKTPNGLNWLTIPVSVKGKLSQRIVDTKIADARWRTKHWKTIQQNYTKSKFFNLYKETFKNLYLGYEEDYLSEINCRFIKEICRLLGIKTKISWSMSYSAKGKKSERVISLCKAAGATVYLSGPAGKNYLTEDRFKEESIELQYTDYSGYKPYNQLFPPFCHTVSILDLLFNEGRNATHFMKSF